MLRIVGFRPIEGKKLVGRRFHIGFDIGLDIGLGQRLVAEQQTDLHIAHDEAEKGAVGVFARGEAQQTRVAPGLENLKFLATVYDTKPAESELWAQAIARATP